jgi:O-Antigen ligase
MILGVCGTPFPLWADDSRNGCESMKVKNVAAWCEASVGGGLVALLAFTPLAFGTVERWSILIMECGVATLWIVYLLGRLWANRPSLRSDRSMLVVVLSFSVFIVFSGLQTVPLPMRWVEWISPGSARLQSPPALGEAVALLAKDISLPKSDPLLHLGKTTRATISVNALETRRRAGELLSFVALFALVASWTDSVRRVRYLSTSVVLVGSLVGIEALVQYLTWNGRIYWIRKVPPSSAFGPFVNHNHFAGYVEMIVPVAVAMIFILSDGWRGDRSGSQDMIPTGRFALDLRAPRNSEGTWGKVVLLLFATTVLLVSLLLSLSRGGILSSLASGLVLFGLLWRGHRSRRILWTIGICLPVIVVGLIVWIGGNAVRERMSDLREIKTEASFRSRVIIWETIVTHVPDFLWGGAGLGAFEDSFAAYTPRGSSTRWDKAHNDYLQTLWESGVIGSAPLLMAIGIFLASFWWSAIKVRDAPLDPLRAGIAVSILSIGLHSCVDFNLQIGANGFLLALLAGLLVSLTPPGRLEGRGEPESRPSPVWSATQT